MNEADKGIMERLLCLAEQHLEETRRRYSQDSFFCRDSSSVLLAEQNLRKVQDQVGLQGRIRRAEQNLESLRKHYPEPDTVFVVYAEQRLRRLRGFF